MPRFLATIIGILAAFGALILVALGLRSRIRKENFDIASQAVELARKDADRERQDATETLKRETEAGRVSAAAALEAIDAEVDNEARVGDLGDAVDRLRGGGYTGP